MTKQESIYRLKKELAELKSENSALRRNVADYKHRHDIAVDALADVSAGYGIRLEGGKTCHQTLAKNALARIAKYPLREAP